MILCSVFSVGQNLTHCYVPHFGYHTRNSEAVVTESWFCLIIFKSLRERKHRSVRSPQAAMIYISFAWETFEQFIIRSGRLQPLYFDETYKYLILRVKYFSQRQASTVYALFLRDPAIDDDEKSRTPERPRSQENDIIIIYIYICNSILYYIGRTRFKRPVIERARDAFANLCATSTTRWVNVTVGGTGSPDLWRANHRHCAYTRLPPDHALDPL